MAFRIERWALATTIQERAHAADPERARILAANADASDLAKAAYRERLWRELPGFDSGEVFIRRLKLLGVESRQHLLDLLAIEACQLADGPPPDWVRTIVSAYETEPEPASDHYSEYFSGLSEGELDKWPDILNSVLEPLFASKIAETAVDLRQQANAFGVRDDIELILAARPHAMYRYIVGAFVLQMHIAERQTSQAKQFTDYLADILSGPGLRRLFEEYPVLGRVLSGVVSLWIAAETLLARRYIADWIEIASFLKMSSRELKLTAVTPALGDPHQGLQTVHALVTESGARLIYKPTDCRVFEHIAGLVRWMRQHDTRLGFRVPSAISRAGYGWVEYIHREECSTEKQLADFYFRMGSTTAISWLLGASDLHSENLTMSRGEPVLLDAETIVGLRLSELLPERKTEPLSSAMMQSSVLSTGLVPCMTRQADGTSIDISALGDHPGQMLSLEAWSDPATPRMRRERREVERRSPNSVPIAQPDITVPVQYYAANVIDGFTRTSELFLQKKTELLSADSPLTHLGRGRYRLLFRNTAVYGRLSQQLNHPDLLTEGTDRDRHLDYLMCGTADDADLATIASEERNAVDRGDVPYFSFDGDSRDLRSDGKPLLRDWLPSTGVEAIRERLRQLGRSEIDRQRWYLSASLATSSLNQDNDLARSSPTCCSDVPADAPADTDLLTGVERIARDLMTLRYDAGSDGVAWPTVRSFQGNDWQVVAADNSLYSGTAGIALFLGLAGKILDDAHMISTARRSLESVAREIRAMRVGTVGAYDGAAAYLYALSCLAEAWNTDYSDLQRLLLYMIRNSAARDTRLDVLSGVAGAGLVIANGGTRWTDANLALEAAAECARQLAATQREVSPGIAVWPALNAATPFLTGFAHGAAGISLACSRLSQFLDQPSLAVASTNALNYERALFIPDAGNWADLRNWRDRQPAPSRSEPDQHRAALAWCNGAVGIGIARCLTVLNCPDGAQVGALQADIDVALATARQQALGWSHCLCHGDLGVMELHFAASRLPERALEAEHARLVAGMVARDMRAWGPVCGVPSCIVVPGLMTGLAGIGFGLLRALRQDIPNVCGLEFQNKGVGAC
jgi:type 2 lantibiotic biosynthesis protein LanM